MNAAAILLCAGKGTRMGAAARSKVCFDCAGVPVIRRIIANMRAGGVSRFVVVVGHHAQSVMDCLDGEPGVLYAYQKEQKGTGHATQCGLRVLEEIGHAGDVVVSMGDKIVAPHVVKELLADRDAKIQCVFGVEPRERHYNGGHVVFADGRPLGIVEYADVKTGRDVVLGGRRFTAAEVAGTPWVNTALYRFNASALSRELANCRADNAQGEIYLTDVVAAFAARGALAIYEVRDARDIRTYSTRPELRAMSREFLRTAAELLDDPACAPHRAVIEKFIALHGRDRRAVLATAPGRVNLMGRHVEHRGGNVNVMGIDRATAFVAAPRDDDRVTLANLDAAYPPVGFSIGEGLALGGVAVPCSGLGTAEWLEYLDRPEVVRALGESRGSWANYVKAAAYRFQMASDIALTGMDVVAGGDIPVAAGLSSSSSIVVAAAEALVALNGLNVPQGEFVELCGEGEWFVGSRGGPGDHAAMKCCRPGRLTHLNFKPFSIGESIPFSPEYSVVVADSCQQAKKSEGARDVFNGRVAAYEFAFMLIKRAFPDRPLVYFRDLASVRPFSLAYRMIKSLPQKVTRNELRKMLPESGDRLEQLFSTHADPGEYDLRGVAMFGIGEVARAAGCMDVLAAGDYAGFGAMMKTSHDGDRLPPRVYDDAELDRLAACETDFAKVPGAYACSTERIDALCDVLNATPGVLGSELSGAGLGGCVLALVEKAHTDEVVEKINHDYYDRFGLPRSALVCTASGGSRVVY